jgi:hypothetical protein
MGKRKRKYLPTGLRRFNKIGGQFSWRLIEMMEAPTFRVLSLSAHCVLDRIEIEQAHHGGKDNGSLPVTYSNFVDYGIDRHAIAPALRELKALGFIRIKYGRGGNSEFREANKFTLTYRPTEMAPPTNDWKKIHTLEQAREIARMARTIVKTSRSRKQKPVGIPHTGFGGGTPH